jgi:hypothetical protein
VQYKRGEFEQAVQIVVEEAVSAASVPDPVVLDHLGDAMYRIWSQAAGGRAVAALATARHGSSIPPATTFASFDYNWRAS